MKGITRGQIKFIFYMILSILFAFYLLFLSIKNELISKILYVFIFTIVVIGLLAAAISFYKRFTKVKHILRIKKEKEKNIRDFYRYQRFLEPTDFNINN